MGEASGRQVFIGNHSFQKCQMGLCFPNYDSNGSEPQRHSDPGKRAGIFLQGRKWVTIMRCLFLYLLVATVFHSIWGQSCFLEMKEDQYPLTETIGLPDWKPLHICHGWSLADFAMISHVCGLEGYKGPGYFSLTNLTWMCCIQSIGDVCNGPGEGVPCGGSSSHWD